MVRCSADADTTIVSKALACALTGKEVVVFANDTDILVMLVYHWNDTMADIYFQKQTSKSTNVYSIRAVCESLSPAIKEYILFAHAWSGCDTTSYCFSFGKTWILKSLQTNPQVQDIARTMSDTNASCDDVSKAGIRMFGIMYGEKDASSLTSLRHTKFQSMLAQKMKIDVERLPPSDRAAHFHSLRVHHQVRVWATLDDKVLEPTNWGWKQGVKSMEPIPTDLEAAPETILRKLRCKCNPTKSRCANNNCSCRQNGLKCVAACGGCHGQNCSNSEPVDLEL